MRAALIACIALTGCATQESVYLPDGRQGFAITCSGTDLNWDDCYAKAGNVCRSKGYEIVRRDSDTGASAAATQYGAYGGTIQRRSLLIACK